MKFDNYSKLQEIASGANATCYKARHLFLDRDVAIKIYNKQSPTDKRNKILQGRLESQKVVQATLPQIITIYDAGIKNGKYFTIMEYFEGRTLNSWLTSQKPNMAMRAHLCRHILIHIFSLAEFGLFHGDLHTKNILIGAMELPDKPWWVKGEALCPDYRIIDFGTSEFSGKVSSTSRHWKVFHQTVKSLLRPFDIDILHPKPKPQFEKLLELFEWYHSFIASIPWFLATLGHLHPLGYNSSPFPYPNKIELLQCLSANSDFEQDAFRGDDYDWGTFDYDKHRNIEDIQMERAEMYKELVKPQSP